MDRAQLTGKIIKLQHQVNRAMEQYAPEVWMDLPLTIAQLKSLFFIGFQGKTNFKNLASALGVTPANVTGIVDRLVEQGLVLRRENPEDRRILLLEATDKGNNLVSELKESGISHMSCILGLLSMEDLSALTQGLSALAKAVEIQHGETRDEHNRS
jgi:DNA-binding MarR family transcriptional regulator